jgi:hypothetical protein
MQIDKHNTVHKQTKGQKHLMVSIDAEKSLRQNSKSTHNESPEETWNRRDMVMTPCTKHHTKQETGDISSESRKRQGCPLSTLSPYSA